jgi:hypothetical protein
MEGVQILERRGLALPPGAQELLGLTTELIEVGSDGQVTFGHGSLLGIGP